MNHIERFMATIERRAVDRPASWLGLPVPEAQKELLDYFKINHINRMTYAVDDDIYPVELPYHSPGCDAIYMALDFTSDHSISEENRSLNIPGFFKDYHDLSKIDDFNWPDPEEYIDPLKCREAVEAAPKDKAILGVLWSAHFQDACAAFGMEEAMMKMILEPEMFQAVIDRILAFYLKANEIFYKATEGKIHAVLIGNDLGSQTGLMVSPELIRKMVLPGTRKLIEQAHRYGLKVIHHSCGAIKEIIGDLIDAGCDAIHPIQALAAGMEPDRLSSEFGSSVAFCGGVDAQYLLVNGSETEVINKVRELKKIFPTGLIISPSHEAILPDIPPSNIKALFQSVHETI